MGKYTVYIIEKMRCEQMKQESITKRAFLVAICFVLLLTVGTVSALALTSGAQYALQTSTGNYLTAVGGGGRIDNVIHSDATKIQAWETFTVVSLGHKKFALKTYTGNYLTAVGGGGRTTDVIHSDATKIQAWETFTFRTIKKPK
jgi:large exoprotein involved in heme utilization and adhesion